MGLPLGALRAIQARYLTDTCTVLRFTSTSSSDGEAEDWQPIATDVPCRVSQTGAAASESAGDTGALRAVSDWRLWLPYGQDVTPRDRIEVSDGRVFEVERVDEKTNETARRCLVTLIG